MPQRGSAWSYALRRTIHVLLVERVADIAATLAFYSVLSVFPALLAIFGTFGLVGQGPRTAATLVSYAGRVVPKDLLAPFRSTIEHFAGAGGAGAGVGTALGLIVAVWTASRYVSAFGGALNRVYGVQEGRRYWKRRLVQFAVTLAIVALTAIVLFVVLLSNSVLGPHGLVPLSGVIAVAWSVLRWLIAVAATVVVIVLLYWGTPNVRQPRLRWMTEGGITALVLMAAASGAFVFYVSHFSTFHREYGAVAALVIFLVWLWLMNLMLLFGAGLDVELERVRELRLGDEATRAIRLPLRDDARIESLRRRNDRLAAEARSFLPTPQQIGRDGQGTVDSVRDPGRAGHDAGAPADLIDGGRDPERAGVGNVDGQ